jgi:uncharacterized protein (DUF302 family)
MTRYALEKTIDLGHEETVQKVTALLAEEGFGILSDIDVKQTLKAKIDVDFRPYRILGACNPPLAKKALEAEAQVGVLLPCNVVVWEEGDRTTVAAMDPVAAIGQLSGNATLDEVATDVRARLSRVLDKL